MTALRCVLGRQVSRADFSAKQAALAKAASSPLDEKTQAAQAVQRLRQRKRILAARHEQRRSAESAAKPVRLLRSKRRCRAEGGEKVFSRRASKRVLVVGLARRLLSWSSDAGDGVRARRNIVVLRPLYSLEDARVRHGAA